jgi:hypothetical protein
MEYSAVFIKKDESEKQKIDVTEGLGIHLGHLKDVKGKTYSIFNDDDSSVIPGMPPRIATELKRNKQEPPILLKLETKEGCLPGIHALNFDFTYFNGENWQISHRSIQIKVRNHFERNITIYSVAGIIIALIGISNIILDFIINFLNLF